MNPDIPALVLTVETAASYFVTALVVGIVLGIFARLTAIGRG